MQTRAFDYMDRILPTKVHFDYGIDNIDVHRQRFLIVFIISISIFLSFLFQMMTKLEPSMRFSAQPIVERKCIYQSKWPNCDRKLQCQCFQVCRSNYLIISFSQRLSNKSRYHYQLAYNLITQKKCHYSVTINHFLSRRDAILIATT